LNILLACGVKVSDKRIVISNSGYEWLKWFFFAKCMENLVRKGSKGNFFCFKKRRHLILCCIEFVYLLVKTAWYNIIRTTWHACGAHSSSDFSLLVEVLLSWQKVDIIYTRAFSTPITSLPNSEIVSTSRYSKK
jgi:hypothetical protein